MTLSPAPNFAQWLKRERANEQSQVLTASDRAALANLDTVGWWQAEATREPVKEPLIRAAAWYYLHARTRNGSPLDSVARFHLGNGARLERLNWLADTSERAIAQACGLMVNYLYDLEDIEKNHEAYAQQRTVVASKAVTKSQQARRRATWCRWATSTWRRCKAQDLSIDRHDRAARDRVLRRGEEQNRRRDFLDLGPGRMVGFRHGGAVRGRVHDRGRDRVDQDAELGHLLGERDRERHDRGLAGRIGGHAGAAARFERGPRRDIDDAAAAAGHRVHGGAAAQERGDEIHLDLLHQLGLAWSARPAPSRSRRPDGSMPTAD